MDLKTIKEKLFNTTDKKCLMLFIIVFIIIVVGGFISNNKNPIEDMKVFEDKYNDSNHYYVICANNTTLTIDGHGDDYNKELWDSIEVGKKYRFIIKDPELTDINIYPNIIQIHNVTS